MKKTLTAIALAIGLSTTANATETLKATNWTFIPEQGMNYTILELTLKNNTDKPVKAFTGKITCEDLLGEKQTLGVKATSTRIPANSEETVQWMGVSMAGYGGLWDYVETGRPEDFTCSIEFNKVVQ